MKRNRRLSRRAERERQSKRKLLLAVVIALGVAGISGALFWTGKTIHPPLDPHTFCPTEGRPSEEHLVLLDATDEWSDLQRLVIRQEIEQLQNRLPRFARVHLYTIDRDPGALPESLFALCNPGRPEDLEELPILGGATAGVVANPRKMTEQWRMGFVARMDSVLVGYVGTAPESRIMETLRGASTKSFGIPSEDKPPRRVHIFSDMLQNSAAYSHYGAEPWTPDRALHMADLGRLGSRALEGADVTIYLLDRSIVGRRTGQGRGDLITFWDQFLAAQGATLMRVERI